ncbi:MULTISPECIES: MGMT family protein [unclassified Pseudomonas]|uniref:MGMT family protein n=1 Tax=unclassified Pseudomonas TaxID=196821 RepID=UPI00257B3C7C|nr:MULTISPECIES: MGMT family protein [unclassified Pseudomonas]
MPHSLFQHSDTPETRQTALFGVMAEIPPGKVVSYGQLAELAGLGRAARWVGRTLSRLPEGTTLPWHRVIGADGRISLPSDSLPGIEQRQRLRAEGIIFHNDQVDMRRHRWNPLQACE